MDEKRTQEGSARRLFLKKAVAAGAAVWSAPAVFSYSAGRAWAQTYPPYRDHVPDGDPRPVEPDGPGRPEEPAGEPRDEVPPSVPR